MPRSLPRRQRTKPARQPPRPPWSARCRCWSARSSRRQPRHLAGVSATRKKTCLFRHATDRRMMTTSGRRIAAAPFVSRFAGADMQEDRRDAGIGDDRFGERHLFGSHRLAKSLDYQSGLQYHRYPGGQRPVETRHRKRRQLCALLGRNFRKQPALDPVRLVEIVGDLHGDSLTRRVADIFRVGGTKQGCRMENCRKPPGFRTR